MGSWQLEVKKVKKVAIDNNTVTGICLPSKKGYGSKAVKKTWKNYCPNCKKRVNYHLIQNELKKENGLATVKKEVATLILRG